MADPAQPSPEGDAPTQAVLELAPLSGGGTWTVRLGPDLMTLSDAAGDTVLTLHQTEAARYMRFANDIFRGRTVSFVVVMGFEKHRFRCTKEQLVRLLAWLPRKGPEEAAREIRYSGIGVALFGVLHLLVPQHLFWGCGLVLFAAGAVGIAAPRRQIYVLNGVLMTVVGLWDLYPRRPAENHLLSVVVGSILILWGIQQLSMLEANQHLRAAREIRDRSVAFRPGKSGLTHWAGLANVLAAVVFGLYAIAVLASVPFRMTSGAMSGFAPVLPDLGVFSVLAVLTGLSAVMLLLRQKATYLEAKVSAQLLVAATVLTLWGIVFSFHASDPFSFFGRIFAADLYSFTRPYVWMSLILCVVGFNRWFARVMDRELETLRD